VLCHPGLAERHADAGGNALAEGAGGGFDAGCPAVFRVTGTFTVQLPEILDVVESHRNGAQLLICRVDRFYAAQMQGRVKQH